MVNFYISKEKNGIKQIIINVKEGKQGGQNNLEKTTCRKHKKN